MLLGEERDAFGSRGGLLWTGVGWESFLTLSLSYI